MGQAFLLSFKTSNRTLTHIPICGQNSVLWPCDCLTLVSQLPPSRSRAQYPWHSAALSFSRSYVPGIFVGIHLHCHSLKVSSPGSPPRKRHVIVDCCASFSRPDLLTDTLSVKLSSFIHLMIDFCNMDSFGSHICTCCVLPQLWRDLQKIETVSHMRMSCQCIWQHSVLEKRLSVAFWG